MRVALMVVGWLLVVGSAAISALAGPHMSETEIVRNSLYVVLVFGFGLGLALGAIKDIPWAFYSAAVFCIAAAFARWWLITKVLFPRD